MRRRFSIYFAIAISLASYTTLLAQPFPPPPPPGGGLTERDLNINSETATMSAFDPFHPFLKLSLTAEHVDLKEVTATGTRTENRWTVRGFAPFVGFFSQNVPAGDIDIDLNGGTVRIDTLIDRPFFFPQLFRVQASCTATTPTSDSQSQSEVTDPITGLTSRFSSKNSSRQAACIGKIDGIHFNSVFASMSEQKFNERVR
ncbi:MAG: hypothetical protein ACE5HN_01385 [Nitrospiria bacterium]